MALFAVLVLTSCAAPSPPSHSSDPHPIGAWRRIASAPISSRIDFAAVWAGTELIVWGGLSFPSQQAKESTGAAYDPATNNWRTLPDAPIAQRRAPMAAFTGTEFLVWGGLGGGDQPLADGAAYELASDTWRTLPESPLSGGAGFVGAWTGADWLLVEAGTAVAPNQASGQAAAYNPATNSWRPIADAPLPPGWASVAVWTGSHLVVVRIATEGESSGAQYDPTTDEWSPIPANDELTIETYPFAVWTGRVVMLIRGPIQTSAGLGELSETWEYDPVRQEWRRSTPPPSALPLSSPAWTGDRVVFYASGGRTSIDFSPADESWSMLPAAPDRDREGWASTWTGTDLIIWGGSSPAGGEATSDGVAIRLHD